MPYFKFRMVNNDLKSFDKNQKSQIKKFQDFVMEKPDGFCCVCMKILYPEDQKYSKISKPDDLPCIEWKRTPLFKEDKSNNKKYMVCTSHTEKAKSKESDYIRFEYPGDLIPEIKDLNYREKSVLSPIRLMSQVIRKSTLYSGRIGHYEMKGAVYSTPNFEFAEMVYGGTLGLFFQRGTPSMIRKLKVKKAYKILKEVNPLVARYELPKLTYEFVNYHIVENKKHIGSSMDWKNNILFANDETNPQAADVNFNDLIIGKDMKGNMINYSYPSLLALIFPHIFTTCTGHYSYVSLDEDFRNKTGIFAMPENQGGAALATIRGESMTSYARSRLMMIDRRFSLDPLFLFFMLDIFEKKNKSAANRFVVSTKQRGTKLKQKDVFNNATKKHNTNIVSLVPPQIRSSYAYKRKNYLDLQCIFDNLGAPQLFLTFTCANTSEDFVNLNSNDRPWEDPVKFTLHWKRKWQKFFLKYILEYFGAQIGGIKDYSWVLEIQDRGSPHCHLVLWTKASLEELIQKEVVHTWYPRYERSQDPLMYRLVETLQVHKCNTNYCKHGDLNRECRFGFPKPSNPATEVLADKSCIYKRGENDRWINNYNPYLLATFRTSMDIQYNNGPQAVRYLAKYLAKDDYESKVRVESMRSSGQGYYQKPSTIKESDHYKTRIVGAVEAVYDVMGWHKHGNSRSVMFLNTGLLTFDTRRVRNDIEDLDEDDEDIYAAAHVEIYEKRSGADTLTMPEFFCFYLRYYGNRYSKKQKTSSADDVDKEIEESDQEATTFLVGGQSMVQTEFHPDPLPQYVSSGKLTFSLRKNNKLSFWRTFNQSEMNGEGYYYQQIVSKKAIFNTTYEKAREPFRSWVDYYEHLIFLPIESGGIAPHEAVNIKSFEDIREADRGIKATMKELKVMLASANSEQRSIYNQIKSEMKVNSAVFVSGAAGTGKSFVLKMFEKYYRTKGFKVIKMVPTGVAAHNISGQTLHRFFGMTNRSSVPNYQLLGEIVKLYPKLILLIDEYSMISAELLDVINEALIKTTQRSTVMGGVKTIFFGDIAQLLPVQKREGTLWTTQIFNCVKRFDLVRPVRQKDDLLVQVLNKVRICEFDKSVIEFINSRSVPKHCLPSNCLRLYTTRELVNRANAKDFKDFSTEEGFTIDAHDSFSGTEGTARAALKETRLLETLLLKTNMPVMLIQNLNVTEGLINGTIAAIHEVDENNICLKKNVDGNELFYWIQRITRQVPGTSYVRSQFPIVPAFATTIHKAQSATIDCVGIHLDNMLTHGQLYVAMSRVRRIDYLFFFGADIPLRNIKRKYGCDADAIEIVRKKLKSYSA